jgi:hypothetical protein
VSWFSLGGVAASGSGGGIRFDTYPQAGNWLYAETDDSTGSPNGYGLDLEDNSAGGINIAQNLGNTTTLSAGSNSVQLTGNSIGISQQGAGDIAIQNIGSGGIQVSDTSTTGVLIQTSGSTGPIVLHDIGGGGVQIGATGSAGTVISNASGSVFFIPTTSRPILVVGESSGAANPTVQAGVDTADWFVIYDRNGGSSTVNERFRFYGNGQCQMLTLPTSSVGLPAGSLWNNLGIVNIV